MASLCAGLPQSQQEGFDAELDTVLQPWNVL
jgi:hypothetical protein